MRLWHFQIRTPLDPAETAERLARRFYDPRTGRGRVATSPPQVLPMHGRVNSTSFKVTHPPKRNLEVTGQFHTVDGSTVVDVRLRMHPVSLMRLVALLLGTSVVSVVVPGGWFSLLLIPFWLGAWLTVALLEACWWRRALSEHVHGHVI